MGNVDFNLTGNENDYNINVINGGVGSIKLNGRKLTSDYAAEPTYAAETAERGYIYAHEAPDVEFYEEVFINNKYNIDINAGIGSVNISISG